MSELTNYKFKFVLSIIMVFVITLGARMIYNLDWIYDILIGCVGGFIILLLIRLGILKITKEDTELLKKQFESYSTKDLSVMIKSNEEAKKYLIEEFDKRKDKTTWERLCELANDYILYGMVILVLGLFYIGAIAPYFHVNDEFINPTNISNGSVIGYTNAFDNVQNVTTQKIFILFHDIGAKNPTLWFWLWWFAVFYFMILPILKFIYYLIRRKHAKN